jgi:hypothetical protein
MKVWKSIAAAAALAVAAGAGQASTINVGYQNDGDIFNGNAKGQVTVAVTDVRPSVRVNAGGFALTGGDLGDFIAWCLDVGANIFPSSVSNPRTSPYVVTDSPFANSVALTTTQIGQITRLFDAYYDPGAVTNVLNNAAQATAFQVALWTLVYGDALSATNPSPSNAVTTANSWVSFVQDAGNDISRVWRLTFLQSTTDPRSQNLVTVSAIPLPAGGWLLVVAIGGLAVAARRRKAADA